MVFLLSFIAYPQGKGVIPPKPPAAGRKGPPGKPHPELPIDGGLSFLLIAGTAYGIYESRKKK